MHACLLSRYVCLVSCFVFVSLRGLFVVSVCFCCRFSMENNVENYGLFVLVCVFVLLFDCLVLQRIHEHKTTSENLQTR